jgi:hypothetical protein
VANVSLNTKAKASSAMPEASSLQRHHQDEDPGGCNDRPTSRCPGQRPRHGSPKTKAPGVAARGSHLPRHQRARNLPDWMRLASHSARPGSTQSRAVEAGSARAYGCTSNAPTPRINTSACFRLAAGPTDAFASLQTTELAEYTKKFATIFATPGIAAIPLNTASGAVGLVASPLWVPHGGMALPSALAGAIARLRRLAATHQSQRPERQQKQHKANEVPHDNLPGYGAVRP